MIPKTYSEALSAQKAAKERKTKRQEKVAAIKPNWQTVIESDKKLMRRAERFRKKYWSVKMPVMFGKKKAKKKKSPSRSKLEKEAWDAFSLYIRERDKDKGCISCGRFDYDVSQAGHMIPRRCRATKYDERNVNLQCKNCNGMDKFKAGYHDHCVTKFVERYGYDVYKELEAKSTETLQQGKADMIAFRDHYREKLLTLKASRAQQSEDDLMQR